MPRTTPIHTNCGTCTECARIPQIVKYKCEKGGSYRLLTGYVGEIEDVCIKPGTGIWWPTVIKCIAVGYLAGAIMFYITGIPLVSAAVCLMVSVIIYLCNEN
jgi:hypothetical protein